MFFRDGEKTGMIKAGRPLVAASLRNPPPCRQKTLHVFARLPCSFLRAESTQRRCEEGAGIFRAHSPRFGHKCVFF